LLKAIVSLANSFDPVPNLRVAKTKSVEERQTIGKELILKKKL